MERALKEKVTLTLTLTLTLIMEHALEEKVQASWHACPPRFGQLQP